MEKIDRHVKWKDIITEHEKSGLSQAVFCKERDINPSQFGYYRQVIKSQEKANEIQPLFSTVKIKKPDIHSSADIKIILPNGFQCLIPSAVDMSQVKRLMETLLSC